MPTLGEIKAAGGVPSVDQIRILEIEESRKCNFGGVGPHVFHCQPAGTDQLGRPRVHRIVCWHIKSLHVNLEAMFPGLKIERYKE